MSAPYYSNSTKTALIPRHLGKDGPRQKKMHKSWSVIYDTHPFPHKSFYWAQIH